ncbi:energy-coupling factor transporter ATPase [Paenibacillus silvae]|uniref:energy-coupling factor transporter ATPase n=1 Tax=Paenibacillus TaxID=44249 RepID=UPI001C109C5D|nr:MULTISPECIES: energy-coupling factor transporter ATPase [Paenibacillus]MBU5354498.1 energy-coupling factor transporter ATPase [Paenibacillus barcinonensis]MDM5281604.1 energy-coupling factor transporter ATPase [Paenibacillus silvae]
MQITLKEVGYSYHVGTPLENSVLNDITLIMGYNRIFAVVGRTGSGKSTFIQLLNGLLQPTSGTVDIGSFRMTNNRKRAQVLYDKVGIVFQFPEHQLFEETVFKDISFGPRNLGWPNEKVQSTCLKALHMVGLDESFSNRSPFELSGGEKRRVAIASVLAMNPEVLILDEPTVGLDTEGKEQLMAVVRSWQQEQGSTVIMVTHDMETVAEYADEVIIFEHGQVKRHTTPLHLFTEYQDELKEKGLKLPKAIQLVKAINEKLNIELQLESVKKERILTYIADYFQRKEL